MTDVKSVEEMREVLKKVRDRSERDGIGIYEACVRENVPKTTYYSYKKEVERHDQMMQAPSTMSLEGITMPAEEPKHPQKFGKKHRISIDLPNDVNDYLEKEREEGTLTVKGMCQKIVISYVRDKMSKYEPLFK